MNLSTLGRTGGYASKLSLMRIKRYVAYREFILQWTKRLG